MSLDEKIRSATEEDPFLELSEAEKQENDILAEIAVAIVNRRNELGLTQTQFAGLCGVTQSTVSKWENADSRISMRTLANILSVLKMNLRLEPVEVVQQNTATTFVVYVPTAFQSPPRPAWQVGSNQKARYACESRSAT